MMLILNPLVTMALFGTFFCAKPSEELVIDKCHKKQPSILTINIMDRRLSELPNGISTQI